MVHINYEVIEILSDPMKFEYEGMVRYGVAAKIYAWGDYKKEMVKFDTLEEAEALKVGDIVPILPKYKGR